MYPKLLRQASGSVEGSAVVNGLGKALTFESGAGSELSTIAAKPASAALLRAQRGLAAALRMAFVMGLDSKVDEKLCGVEASLLRSGLRYIF